jgi:hypothetical protein
MQRKKKNKSYEALKKNSSFTDIFINYIENEVTVQII